MAPPDIFAALAAHAAVWAGERSGNTQTDTAGAAYGLQQ